RLLSFAQALEVRTARVLHGELQAVLHWQQLCGELLESITVGRLDVALGALADVVELGGGAYILLPVALGALIGLDQRLLQTLQLRQLGCALGQDALGFRSRRGWRGSWGVVGTHLRWPPKSGRKGLATGSVGRRPRGGGQRREFKAAPRSLAVMST